MKGKDVLKMLENNPKQFLLVGPNCHFNNGSALYRSVKK